jgi:hypothetical protein
MEEFKTLEPGEYRIILSDCECFDCWEKRILK